MRNIFLSLIVFLIIKLTKQFEYTSNKILLDQEKTFNIPYNKCFLIRANHLFQHLDIAIKAKGISKLIITNEKIIDESTSYPQCNKNSTICYELIYPTQAEYQSNYCVLSTYIYGCAADKDTSSNAIDNNNNNSTAIEQSSTSDSSDSSNSIEIASSATINVMASLNQTKTCIPFKETLEIDCSQLGDKCANPDVCVNKCEYLQCYDGEATSTDSLATTNLCIPQTTAETKQSLCSNIHPTKKVNFTSTPCTSKKESFTELEEESKENKFFKVVSIIIGILIVILLISSLYYRVKVKDEGIEPFTPPSFFPGFLFPRPKKEETFLSNK